MGVWEGGGWRFFRIILGVTSKLDFLSGHFNIIYFLGHEAVGVGVYTNKMETIQMLTYILTLRLE